MTWFTTGAVVKITDFGLSRIRLDNKRVICDAKNTVFNSQRDVDQVTFLPFCYRDDFLDSLAQVFQEFATIKILSNTWVTGSEVEEAWQKRSEMEEGTKYLFFVGSL